MATMLITTVNNIFFIRGKFIIILENNNKVSRNYFYTCSMTTAKYLLKQNNGQLELIQVHKNVVIANGDDLALVRCEPSIEDCEEFQSLHEDDLFELVINETPINVEKHNDQLIRIGGKVVISW
jgi:hypothetical protein